MYASLTSAFLPALRAGHTSYGYLEAWYGGEQVSVDDGLGNSTTRLPLLESGTNQVVVDAATPGARRTLAATLAPVPGLWEALEPAGTELHAFVVVRYLNGVTETVPQGVFPIDVEKIGYGPGGTLSLTAPDRWALIQDARFAAPRAADAGATNRVQIASLLTEALPSGLTVSDTGTSTATVPAQTWDRDRDQAVQALAKAASLDVFFDRNGIPVIRDVPVLNPSDPAWTIDQGPGGVLIDADRERNRQKTYNVVVVSPQQLNGDAPFAPVVVWDADSSSPTYAGPGAGVGGLTDLPDASEAGPFGQRFTFYSSPLLTTTGQAQAAGLTILARVTGLAAQLTLTSVPNAALDDGDTILVTLPPLRRPGDSVTEVHIVDGFTVPLVPSRNAMPVTTRSTRPDDVTDS